MAQQGIMCCGCNRFLGADGQPVVIFPPETGFIERDPSGRITLRKLTKEQIKEAERKAVRFGLWFPSADEADTFAQRHGWQVKDRTGASNHRCPDCLAAARQQEHAGAFIDIEMFR